MRNAFLLCALSLSWAASAASAAGIFEQRVEGNLYSAKISLAGAIEADLTITFESVTGLDVDSLDVSARLVSLGDLAILDRLPSASEIPVPFPVVLTIASAPGSDLSFRGVARVELYTQLLHYEAGTPLRLVSAAPGEPFQDYTATAGSGSYRVGGRTPDFGGENMILINPLPQVENVARKLTWLEATLERNAESIVPEVYAKLEAAAEEIRQAWDAGSPENAQAKITALETLIEVYGGTGIPNEWRAGDPTANVAGELRRVTGTLGYSLLEGGAGDG